MMDLAGSYEPRPKNKEEVSQTTLKEIFTGLSSQLIKQGRIEDLPTPIGSEHPSRAFYLPLRPGMIELAMETNPENERVVQAEASYFESHVPHESPEETLPPQLILEIRTRSSLPMPDKFIMYRIQEIGTDEYEADVSVHRDHPPTETLDEVSLQHYIGSNIHPLHNFISEIDVGTHDLTPQEARHMQRILHALEP